MDPDPTAWSPAVQSIRSLLVGSSCSREVIVPRCRCRYAVGNLRYMHAFHGLGCMTACSVGICPYSTYLMSHKLRRAAQRSAELIVHNGSYCFVRVLIAEWPVVNGVQHRKGKSAPLTASGLAPALVESLASKAKWGKVTNGDVPAGK